MADLLFEIGTVIIAATILAYATRLLKQPMILGYVIAGFVIGPYLAGLITSTETITLLSELGIAFLLFIVGLEIDFGMIRESGRKAAMIGIGQVAFTGVAGYFLAGALGFAPMESFYIAVALTMSSTMIVIKLLSDKGALDTVHGRLILGMLLIQDVVAIFILALLPALGHDSAQLIIASAAKGLAMIAAAFIAAKYLLPAVLRGAARSTELLFLSAVSWLFIFAFFAQAIGYSIAIGSFLAGVSLAPSVYRLEMASRVKSLKDFFATIFFVSLGMQLALPSLGEIVVPALAFSAFVIAGNPVIVAALGMLLGYNKRISIMTGLPMGQISEFSLIVAALGVSLGHIGSEASAVVVAVAAITITVTTYVIKYDEAIYRLLKKALRLGTESEAGARKARYDAVLCGYNRIGYSIANKLREMGKSFVVVDFDPDIISKLKRQRIPCIYGDIGDAELMQKLNIQDAKLVVSTVPSIHENEMIIREARKGDAIAIVTSNHIETALRLYETGAHYVILPHFLGGEHVAMLLDEFRDGPSVIRRKFRHIRELHQRRMLGHAHPV